MSLTKDSNEIRIIKHLEELMKKGGEGSFLIISAGEFYMQFARVSSVDIYAEAVSEDFLHEGFDFTEKMVNSLYSYGLFKAEPEYEDDREGKNYSGIWKASNEKEIVATAKKIIEIFEKVYGLANDCNLDYKLEIIK
ncbi:MAG: hypothetical protein QMC67_03190 [Candidatus Wallbacteria bacterium]